MSASESPATIRTSLSSRAPVLPPAPSRLRPLSTAAALYASPAFALSAAAATARRSTGSSPGTKVTCRARRITSRTVITARFPRRKSRRPQTVALAAPPRCGHRRVNVTGRATRSGSTRRSPASRRSASTAAPCCLARTSTSREPATLLARAPTTEAAAPAVAARRQRARRTRRELTTMDPASPLTRRREGDVHGTAYQPFPRARIVRATVASGGLVKG